MRLKGENVYRSVNVNGGKDTDAAATPLVKSPRGKST